LSALPHSLEEIYALHGGSFTLDDPRPTIAASPYTFFVPPSSWIDAVQAGDWVKAIFRAQPADRKFDAERMWVKVEEVLADGFAGRLDTDPSDMPQLTPGAALFVPREWVIDVDFADGHELPLREPRREYWDRCFVDACVVEGLCRVDYLYREVPDLAGPDDKYPDSGWRIRAPQEAIDADAQAGRKPLYVALGAVLNQDDRWLHLIDEPVGEAFQWWEEEQRFVRLDPE
jgi:hypothetical protein